MAEAPLPEPLRAALRHLGYETWMRRFPRASAAAGLALLGAGGALSELGWPRSFAQRVPIDREGAPLPWFTYPAISVLAPRISASLRVFEYGAGNSTRWWAARVAAVRSVENDAQWTQLLAPQLPSHAQLLFAALDGDDGGQSYVDGATIAAAADGAPFDVIVIDGRERNRCVAASLRSLSERGVIVWDNSERERYASGLQIVTDAGFRRLDLHGMGPVNPYAWCTTILYRDGNCLGL